MYKSKKKYPPRPGGIWVKKSKKGQKMYTVSLRAEVLPEPDEKGFIKLIGFVNDRKESDTHPDINLMVPKENTGYQRRNDEDEEDETPRKAKASRRPVDEEVEEESEDGDSSDDDEDGSIPF